MANDVSVPAVRVSGLGYRYPDGREALRGVEITVMGWRVGCARRAERGGEEHAPPAPERDAPRGRIDRAHPRRGDGGTTARWPCGSPDSKSTRRTARRSAAAWAALPGPRRPALQHDGAGGRGVRPAEPRHGARRGAPERRRMPRAGRAGRARRPRPAPPELRRAQIAYAWRAYTRATRQRSSSTSHGHLRSRRFMAIIPSLPATKLIADDDLATVLDEDPDNSARRGQSSRQRPHPQHPRRSESPRSAWAGDAPGVSR